MHKNHVIWVVYLTTVLGIVHALLLQSLYLSQYQFLPHIFGHHQLTLAVSPREETRQTCRKTNRILNSSTCIIVCRMMPTIMSEPGSNLGITVAWLSLYNVSKEYYVIWNVFCILYPKTDRYHVQFFHIMSVCLLIHNTIRYYILGILVSPTLFRGLLPRIQSIYKYKTVTDTLLHRMTNIFSRGLTQVSRGPIQRLFRP